MRILRELPRSDPELWAKISGEEDDADLGVELDDSDLMDEATSGEVSGINSAMQDCDAQDSDENETDDTFITPAELMASILGNREFSDVPQIGLADQFDPGDMDIPQAEEYGRGKRRRTLNSKFSDFLGH